MKKQIEKYRAVFFNQFKALQNNKTWRNIAKKCEEPASRNKFILDLLSKALIIFLILPYHSKSGGTFRIKPGAQESIRVKVRGQIESVLVKEGDWVKADTLIARLSKRDISNELDIAVASLNEAKANLEAAKLKLTYSQQEAQRAKQLYEKEQISTQEYENKEREKDLNSQGVQAQEAEAQRLEALVAHYKENLGFTEIRSPIEGRVVTPYLTEKIDHVLEVGDLLATVEDDRNVIAEIDVPEQNISDLKVNARVDVKTWAYYGISFKGKVISVAPVAADKQEAKLQRSAAAQEEGAVRVLDAPEEKIVRVLAELPNPKGLLKSGVTGYAKISGRWRPMILVLSNGLIRFFCVEVWSWLP